jgi:hypothetical protein
MAISHAASTTRVVSPSIGVGALWLLALALLAGAGGTPALAQQPDSRATETQSKGTASLPVPHSDAAKPAAPVPGSQPSANAASPLLEDVEIRGAPLQIDGQTYVVVSRFKRIKGKTSGETEAITSLEIHDSSGATAFSEQFSYEFEKGEFTELCSASAELLSGGMKKWIFISSECLPDAPLSGGPWEILGVANGRLVRWGKPILTQGEFIRFVPGQVSKVGSTTSFGTDGLEFKVWTGYFFVTIPVRIDLTEPKIELGTRCYTQTDHGLGEGSCEVHVEVERNPNSDDTFVRLFSERTEHMGIPTHVIVRKDSKVDFISAGVRFLFDDSGESINLGVGDDIWLKIRIDGKVGWIHTQEDLAAIGLLQSG